MKKQVLFIHGAGEGAYEEDALLAASLQDALGSEYVVRYPKMPENDSATYADWIAQIAAEIAVMDGPLILVGHSVGGSVLLKVVSEGQVEKPVAGLFVIAAPYWGADDFWKWDEAQLPQDADARLAWVPGIFIYHSRDDEVVPFAHLDLYASRLPHALIRVLDGGGHQLRNNLSEVARDITRTG